MPIRKIDDDQKWEINECHNPDHNIPSHIITPGTYEHTCPGCGKITKFIIPKITFSI